MKNLIFYIIFLLTTINLSAQTYQYHPFIDTTKVWVTLFSSGTSPKYFPDDYFGIYYFQGDTFANGFTYNKLWRKNYLHKYQGTIATVSQTPILKYFFREDTVNKVIYYDSYAIVQNEKVYMDLNNISIGDTIETATNIFNTPATVQNILLDTLLNGIVVKKYEYVSPSCTTSSIIEGVQFPIADPFKTYNCNVSNVYLEDYVYCIYNSTGLLYESGLDFLNYGNGCDYYHAISSNSKPLNLTNIYQNSCFQDNNPFNLTFYNYLGIELKKIANITEFCMQDFENGLYIVKIEQNEKLNL